MIFKGAKKPKLPRGKQVKLGGSLGRLCVGRVSYERKAKAPRRKQAKLGGVRGRLCGGKLSWEEGVCGKLCDGRLCQGKARANLSILRARKRRGLHMGNKRSWGGLVGKKTFCGRRFLWRALLRQSP